MRSPIFANAIRRSRGIGRKAALGLGASLLAMVSTPALADCTPDPVANFGIVTCAGIDADGTAITVPNATVNVGTAAVVETIAFRPPDSTAPVFPPFPGFGGNASYTLNLDGEVSDGVVVNNFAGPSGTPFPPTTGLSVNISSTGRIVRSGIFGEITAFAPINPIQRAISIQINNAGMIGSTAPNGFAVSSNNASQVEYAIVNMPTGYIHGVQGNFRSIFNQGIIENDLTPALSYNAGAIGPFGSPTIFNAGGGIIRNSGLSPTINFSLVGPFASAQISNFGSIVNSGAGRAITFITSDPVQNRIGGTVFNGGSIIAGATAIRSFGDLYVDNSGTVLSGIGNGITADALLTLINRGTIGGNVLALGSTSSFNFSHSMVDTSGGGIIDGNITLGATDDVVITDYGSVANPFKNVSGIVDAGGGTDTWIAKFVTDAELHAPFALPATFENFELSLDTGVTVSLVDGFTAPQGIRFGNGGIATLVNITSIASEGPAIAVEGFGLKLDNRGSIASALGDPSSGAVEMTGRELANSGTIRAIGGNAVTGSIGAFDNSGTIVATQAGFRGDAFAFANSGTMTSTAGIGADLTTNGGVNSGTISGAVAGMRVAGLFDNAGLIASPQTGLLIDSFTTFRNLPTGRVSGGTMGIAPGGFFGDPIGHSTIVNQGVIDGNVSLAVVSDFGFTNAFFALPGGMLNGNLDFGASGGVFATTLANGNKPYSGVSGTVTGNGPLELRYLISGNERANLKAPGVFTSIAFDLLPESSLDLTLRDVRQNVGLIFAGTGSVDVEANLVSVDTGTTLISSGALSLHPTIDPGSNLPPNVDVISRGSLSMTANEPWSGVFRAAFVEAGSFINAGTITARSTTAPVSGGVVFGISGGSAITNDGLIRVGGEGVVGIEARNFGGVFGGVFNNGRIEQLAGDAPATGIIVSNRLENRGTISVAGIGVEMDPFARVENYGLIQSMNSIAVAAPFFPIFSGTAMLVNHATGKIVGNDSAFAVSMLEGSTLENAGLIRGNVFLGAGIFGLVGATYLGTGGTIDGDLTFGFAGDSFFYRGGNVTGIVDGGIGIDALSIAAANATGRFDLSRYRNFEFLELLGPGKLALANVPSFQQIVQNGADFAIDAGQAIAATDAFSQSAGRTTVNGTLVTGVADFHGGILSGSGRIVTPQLVLGNAFVTPGGEGKVGTLNVSGDVSASNFGATAILFDIGRTANDSIAITGNGDSPGSLFLFGGSTAALVRNGQGPKFGTTYKIATATGGVFGTFTTVTGQIGVLTPVLTYNANDITLTYQAGSLAAALPAGSGATELAFANALDRLRTGSFTSLTGLFGAVDLMQPGQLGATLRGLAPAGIGETLALGRHQSLMVTGLIADRLSLLGTSAVQGGTLTLMGSPSGLPGVERFGGSIASAAQAGFAARLVPGRAVAGRLPETMSGFVSMGYGDGRSSLSDASPTDRSGRRTWHIAMGLETSPDDRTTVGSAFGYVEGESVVAGNRADTRTIQAAVYANRSVGRGGYVAGLASIAHSRIGTLRNASDGLASQRLSGDANALSGELRAEAGLNLGVAQGLTLTPRIALSASSLKLDTLGESGGELALRLSNVRDQRLEASAGLKLSGSVGLGGGWSIAPELQADYVRRVAGDGGTATVAFANAGSIGFALPYTLQGDERLSAKGGLRLANSWMALTAGFETDTGSSQLRDKRAVAGLSIAF